MPTNSTLCGRGPQPQNGGKPTTSGGSGRPFYQRAGHARAMADAKLPMGARVLFEELVRACGRQRFTWVLQAELAERLGVSRRTVQRYERALVDAGLLTVARVSLWARWRRGGSRRIAVPHHLAGRSLVCPPGVLDEAERVLAGDGVAAPVSSLSDPRGAAAQVSHQRPLPTSSGKKRKPHRRPRPVEWVAQVGHRIAGTLRANVADPQAFRDLRNQMRAARGVATT